MFELCKLDSNQEFQGRKNNLRSLNFKLDSTFSELDSYLIKVDSSLINLDSNFKVRNQGLAKLLWAF
jgi:hypothetical protein